MTIPADSRPSRAGPRERLDPRARTLWRIQDLLTVLPLVALGLAAAWLLNRLGVGWALTAAPPLLAAAVAVVAVVVGPELRWRSWRYEIGDEEVDLQHGLVTTTRTLIPMARVQHVETRRGPLQRRFGLASVILHTAAGSSEIPALADDVADAVRDRIAALARTDDDV